MPLNTSPDPARPETVKDLLAELSVWSPRERHGVFRTWLRGSLSLVHLHVLTVLEDGPMAMSRLAEALDVSVASATGIVDRMEDRRLVERRPSPDDRRVVLVHPTRRGRRVFEVLAKARRDALQPILERMSEEEVSSFLVGLRAMRRIRVAILETSAGPSAGSSLVDLAAVGREDAAPDGADAHADAHGADAAGGRPGSAG